MTKLTRRRKSRQGGQSMLEFTFVGIPLIFILISIFEISRGMWVYQTLAYAAKTGVRYAIVHGQSCTKNGNACAVNFGPATTAPSILWVIRNAGAGLSVAPNTCTAPITTSGITTTCVTLTAGGTTSTCNLTATCAAGAFSTGTLSTGTTLRIDIGTPFNSAIAMLWPGAKGQVWTKVNLYATSTDTVKF